MVSIIFIVSICFMITLLLSAYVLISNPKKGTNILFALFSIPILIWCFGYIFMLSAPSEKEATFWFRVMTSGWKITTPLFLHFVILLTENRIFKKYKWLYILLYITVPVFTYMTTVEMKTITGFTMTEVGWAFNDNRESIWPILDSVNMLIYILMSIAMLENWRRKSSNINDKKQAKIIIVTVLISIVTFLLIIYVPNLFRVFKDLPQSNFSLIVILIWEIVVGYTIIKHGFLIISPGKATESIINTMADGLLIIDSAGKIVNANPSFYKIMHLEKDKVINRTINSIFPETFSDRNILKRLEAGNIIRDMESRILTDGKSELFLSISASPVIDKYRQKLGYVIIIRDISERKQSEKQLQYMATHDALTNLPNRMVLNDRLRNTISRARRYHQLVGILMIDVDRFKEINDSYGHDYGDRFLVAVAKKLSECVRECDTVSRLGGDEFVVLLTDIKSKADIEKVIKRIRSSFSNPILIGKSEIMINLSIGVSIYPDDADNIEELLKLSDLALYRVKASGRNNFLFYSPEINTSARKFIKLEREMKKAIESNEFEIYYQPMYELSSGKLMAMEALLRWNHPELGLIKPMEFIPAAERIGLIIPIGEWVLKKVCQQASVWSEKEIHKIPIAINLSSKQLLDPDLINKIDNALNNYKIAPYFLEIEFTESAAMPNIEETIRIVKELRHRGISIIIDDFGSGYSSMAWLKHLSADAIKIDQFFIQNIAYDPHDAAIVKAIVSMAHSMGIEVVAEGIETEEQLEVLRSMKWDSSLEIACDWVQGFLFSKPVTAKEATELILKNNKTART